MKKALYYAIRRNYGQSVVAVTSTKGPRRWYGRDCRYNESTNGTLGDLRGKFATLEEAEACRSGVLEIDAKYDAQIKIHNEATAKLYSECGRETDEYIASKSNEHG